MKLMQFLNPRDEAAIRKNKLQNSKKIAFKMFIWEKR